MDITPFLTTFGLIALAEFGDKTQLAVIALAAGSERAKVFAGGMLAFAFVTALGVLVGDAILHVVPAALIKIAAGILFAVFGVWIFISKESCETDKTISFPNPLFSTFSMIAIAEMGDKTQFSAITLAAKYDSPYLVFLGAILAFASISMLGIFIGKKLCEVISLTKIRLGAGALFMIFGISFLAGF